VLLLLLLEDFSETELPLGEVSLAAEFEEECFCVTTAGAGTTITGADCTITTAGAAPGAAVKDLRRRVLRAHEADSLYFIHRFGFRESGVPDRGIGSHFGGMDSFERNVGNATQ
jgi:hypothetical protein